MPGSSSDFVIPTLSLSKGKDLPLAAKSRSFASLGMTIHWLLSISYWAGSTPTWRMIVPES